MASSMRLSRRAFAHMLGLGAGAALLAPVAGRGMEEHIRVSLGLPEEMEKFVAAFDRIFAAATRAA